MTKSSGTKDKNGSMHICRTRKWEGNHNPCLKKWNSSTSPKNQRRVRTSNNSQFNNLALLVNNSRLPDWMPTSWSWNSIGKVWHKNKSKRLLWMCLGIKRIRGVSFAVAAQKLMLRLIILKARGKDSETIDA